MPTIAIPLRRLRRAAQVKPSAVPGPAIPISPRPSTGAGKDGNPWPPAFAAPVLIHHTSAGAAGEDDGEAPGVLVLDGPPGTPFVWHQVLPLLRLLGVAPGTIKWPDSPEVDGQTGDPFAAAADIAQLLDDRTPAPAVIVGHGLGVGVALALAASAPRHVGALVLVEPAPDIQPIRLTDRLLAAPILGPVVAGVGFRLAGLALHLPALRRAVLTRQVGVHARDDKALVREITFGPLWRHFVRAQRRLVGDARWRSEQFAGVGCPVFIVTGQSARTVAARRGDALRRLLPRAEVMIADATGCRIPIDDPDCVADAVLLALRAGFRASIHAWA